MTQPTLHIVRTATLLLCVVVFFIAAPAGAVVPADIQDRIRQTAEGWRATQRQQQQLQQISGDPHMAAISSAMNRRVSASMMAQAVMESISRDPSTAREAAMAAMAAAPELSNEIRANLAIAFPASPQTFAPAPSPAPVARPAPPKPKVQIAAKPPAPKPVPAPANEADLVAAEVVGEEDDRDPLENINRAVFSFNDFLDTYLMVPIAKAYRFIMPEPLRAMGRNFFENFNEPVVAINDLLQGDIENAGVSLGRFAVNSTIGLFGFFEVAERIDLKEHSADFGQTLHTYGVGSGPFVMLPFLGPTTARDAVGSTIDSFLNPIGYILDLETRLYLKASEIVVKREEVLDDLDQLREGSLDYYAAVRAAWFQNRARELRKGAPPTNEEIDKLSGSEVDKLFADVK